MRAYASASKEECNNADAEAALSLRALEYEATGKKGTVTAAEVAMHVAALKRYRGHRAVVVDLGRAKKRGPCLALVACCLYYKAQLRRNAPPVSPPMIASSRPNLPLGR